MWDKTHRVALDNLQTIMTKKSIAGIVALVAGFAFVASAMAATYTFSTNLKTGSTGVDVKNLQVVLNMTADTQVSSVGAGSPGNETSYFGNATKNAVIKFQNKYASDILAPVGLTSGTGFVGASTRAKLNAMSGSTTSSTTTSTVPGCTSTSGFSSTTGQKCDASTTTSATPTGAGVAVSSPVQPANGLAIKNSSRVPFTKIALTAGSSDVVVNGITVERTGAAVDSNFSGIVLIDENGTQFDIAKTLGSTHQATIGGTFTVKAGTTKILTVAGNMSAMTSTSGQIASLTVVAVNTSATVTGALPITGASHTTNNTLVIGLATGATSSYDPGTTANKAIGTTGYKFTAVRITADSQEDVRLKSARFYQAGSASASDLSNVKIYVDGTAYEAVSTDRYYTANFGSGIVIAKGLSKDIWISGDITGSNSSGRTIDFDIQKNTDLYVTGETYAQGIIVGGTITTATPALNGWAVAVTGGSMTSITKATSVAAQNIALNLAGQVLGGYETDLTGEPISVQSHVFRVNYSSGAASTNLLTSVSLYNASGAVVAGPVDGVATAGTEQTVTFTDTITYPVGKNIYTLKGKIPSTVSNGVTVTASSTPSSNWTSVTGQTTGNTITLTNGAFTMNTMTVKAATLAITMSTSPAAQFIVAGGNGVTFANIQLDASQSGEDVRFSSLAFTKTSSATTYNALTGCQLFDGATPVNSGSNVFNPAVATTETITFDQTLTVAKNTVKTLTLKCNVSSSATGTYTWTVAAVPTITGVTSGTSVTTATNSGVASATMTIGLGSLVVSTAPSAPSYSIAAAGSTGVIANVIRFRATNEAVNLARIGLTLGTVTASSSPSDLVQVSIWDAGTQVGTAVFTGANRVATSTLSTVVVLPKDADKDLTVKVDFAQIGSGQTGTQGALLTIDNNAGTDVGGTQGTGVGSGTTINASGSTSVAGVRLFKSFPTLALGTLSSTGVADGKLIRFSVTANANGGVGLDQFGFTVATSTGVGVTNINLFGYTDSGYSAGISGFTSGQIQTANLAALTSAQVTIDPASVVNVPAGSTYYFELRGSVSGVIAGSSITTTLLGNSTYPILSTLMGTSTGITANGGNTLVWSPNATTTSTAGHVDWTNGYGVAGLPSSGLIQTRSN